MILNDNLNIVKKMGEIIKQNNFFNIFVHENPDCDALGSSLALKKSLELMNKKVNIVGINKTIVEKYVNVFELNKEIVENEEYDFENSIAIILDTSNVERVLKFPDVKFKDSIRIDHHIYIKPIVNLEWVDIDYSSTSEMVGWFILENSFPMNAKISNYLYSGILTDTGKFMFPNTKKHTFELLLKFYDFNFDKNKVQNNIFLNKFDDVLSDSKLRKHIKITETGIGYLILNNHLTKKYKLNNSDQKVWLLSGMIEIKVWFLIYFNNENKIWKCSIRSRDFDVNSVAKKFNGGGHKLASGFKLENKNEYKKIITEINKLFITKEHE